MKPSSTAYGAAFLRAAENLLPQDKRLFEDPYSANILPPIYKFFVILMHHLYRVCGKEVPQLLQVFIFLSYSSKSTIF